MKKHTTLAAFLMIMFFITSCTPKDQPAEYGSMTGAASIEKETQVTFEDGASISIPSTSLDGPASIKIERNPEKVKTLAPIPEGFVALSEFYNFEITGANLIGPVDITIPYDTSKLPEGEGIPFALFPTSEGWKYVPVELVDGKATIYTEEIGDPLIAWHFTEVYEPTVIDQNQYICDPDIPVQAIDNGDGTFNIVGQVLPLRQNYMVFWERRPASNVPVTLALNRKGTGKGNHFNVTTDSGGNFSLIIDATSGLREGWNWVFANAECDPWYQELAVESRGYAEFEYTPVAANASINPTRIPTRPPVVKQPTAQAPKTPTEYVLLPDVVGLPFDHAQNFLANIGYKVIWIDGTSSFEIGQIYSQAPRAVTLTVPHRTTVVLFRTTETKELTKIELFLQSLRYVRYETTESYVYSLGEKEEKLTRVEYQNDNGTLQTYRYHETEGKIDHEQSFSFSPMTDDPIEFPPIFAGRGMMWWMPSLGTAYSVVEDMSTTDGGCTYFYPAHTWSPGEITQMSINGNSFQAQQYSTSYEHSYTCSDGYIDAGAVEAYAYYDLHSGMLLRSEYYDTTTQGECPSWSVRCDENVGKTDTTILEAVQIDIQNP
jgi:hypothetical protein